MTNGSKLYGFFDGKINLSAFFQTDLNSIFDWASNKQLAIAADKCFVMHYGFNNPCSAYTLGVTNGTALLSADAVSKDLGVWFSSSLKFSDHCGVVAKQGFVKVNLIFSNFESRQIDFLVKLYKVFVRSRIEYATEIWSPFLIRDIELIERVQRLFTRRLPGFSVFSYSERLAKLNLETLKHRRMVKDLVMTYKIVKGLVDLNFDLYFTFAHDRRTRGHDFKLMVNRNRLDVRKHFFANRVVPYWNLLSNEIVNSPSVSVFKNRVA